MLSTRITLQYPFHEGLQRRILFESSFAERALMIFLCVMLKCFVHVFTVLICRDGPMIHDRQQEPSSSMTYVLQFASSSSASWIRAGKF